MRRPQKVRPVAKYDAAFIPDYKDFEILRKFMTERGKILPRSKTGLSAKQQRLLTQSIKRARHLALLPFIVRA